MAKPKRRSARPPAKRKADADRRAEEAPNLVDEAGRESFPASDPPGWTLGGEPSADRGG